METYFLDDYAKKSDAAEINVIVNPLNSVNLSSNVHNVVESNTLDTISEKF